MEIIMRPVKEGVRRKRKEAWWRSSGMNGRFGSVSGCAEKRKMRTIQADADQSLIWYANFSFSQGNLEFEGRI
jgi:hypothetical protein